MNLLSQTKKAKEIAADTDWQAELEDLFLKMNNNAGNYKSVANTIKQGILMVNSLPFEISLKIEIIEKAKEEDLTQENLERV